jgi:hypothetical protein
MPRFLLCAPIAAVLLLESPAAVWADQAGTSFDGELAPGDEVCHGLCDRYGMVWPDAAQVRLRLTTDGFPGFLQAPTTDGPALSDVGSSTELLLTAVPGTPIFVSVSGAGDEARGRYRLEVSPAPARYLVPAGTRPADRTRVPDADAGVREGVARLMEGYRSSSPLMIGRLERIPGLRFAARRGLCYRAAVVLAPGARRTADLRSNGFPTTILQMEVRSGHSSRSVFETSRSTARIIALDSDLCPDENGTLELSFIDRERSSAVPNPGVGPFTLQLFERAATARDLPATPTP